MLRAIIFDLFETLITHFDPNWSPPQQSTAARLGMREDEFQVQWDQFDDEWQKGNLDNYEELLIAVCRNVGHVPDNSVVAELASEQFARLASVFANMEDSIIELVEGLKTRGLRLGLVTNAGDMDMAPWSECRIAPFFL
ncbi:MAG: hypothetical protein O2821_11515 [Chloroflexi bacterium]|nr:hypothetical protein [Chloroflexota bacterium]MDA1228851.1 hypothetical protein [Chloroflexota bacterium]